MQKPKQNISIDQIQKKQRSKEELVNSPENQQKNNNQFCQLQQPKIASPYNLQTSGIMKREQRIKQLLTENKNLKASNKELKRQLQSFEKRLDDTLRNRTASQKKPKISREIIQSMELKNAYKQCQIYKKQIAQLKKKQALYDDLKIQALTNQVLQFEIQKQKLLEEIKGLKRLSKQQEKGLVQLTGTTTFNKIMKQLNQLKEQNKRLNEKMLKQGRQTKLEKLTATNQKRKAKQIELKTTQQKKKQEQKVNNQIDILKAKSEKDSKKIAYLQSQNAKLTTQFQEKQRQIQQKDKQISALRLRLGVLRKQAKIKHSRMQTEPSRNQKSQLGNSTIRTTNLKKPLKSQSQPKQNRQQKNQNNQNHQINQLEEQKRQNITQEVQQNKKGIAKYPRLVEAGVKVQSSYKWNHHQFSSKIKQIQVSQNMKGQINQLNFRYEKGEPNLMNTKANIIKFCCQQNTNEYIKTLKGGFIGNKLVYLSVQTNKGRQHKFGKVEQAPNCTNFSFAESDNEYPGAFFGQNSEDGINRIGCFVQCLK